MRSPWKYEPPSSTVVYYAEKVRDVLASIAACDREGRTLLDAVPFDADAYRALQRKRSDLLIALEVQSGILTQVLLPSKEAIQEMEASMNKLLACNEVVS